jgi:FlaA1/EpsC-like NDP-sugar epimerase
MMEENPCEAIMDNVWGTKVLCDVSVKNDVDAFVMVSTDKAVNPTNVMGASKRYAEIYVQSMAERCREEGKKIRIITTRFGNVLGSNGSVIPYFRSQIEKGGPVTVTHPDVIRYFMTIPEACRLVLEAASFGQNGEIYVFDMGAAVKIVDLARKMIELAGFTPDVDIPIEFVGLRPGEKLYEELLNDEENTLPTEHEKITIAQVVSYNYEEVNQVIAELVKLAACVDVQGMVLRMKQFLPEYRSKNSPFEQLDQPLAIEP